MRVVGVDTFRNNERLWLWVPAFAGTTVRWWRWLVKAATAGSRCRALRGELSGLVFGGQRVGQFAERFARDHLRQLVERQVDAVVGDAALREIIGADALGAIAGADLLLAVGRAGRVLALALGVVDARAQDVHRRRPVFVLRAAVLHHDDDPGRDMGDADRRFRLVDVLAAGALRAH